MKALEIALKSFLAGVSAGTVLAMILDPDQPARPKQLPRDIVDVASEESFPASDPPAW